MKNHVFSIFRGAPQPYDHIGLRDWILLEIVCCCFFYSNFLPLKIAFFLTFKKKILGCPKVTRLTFSVPDISLSDLTYLTIRVFSALCIIDYTLTGHCKKLQILILEVDLR